MTLRAKDELYMPPPTYDDTSTFLTVCVPYGGKFVRVPESGKDKYVGGSISKFDFVELDNFDSLVSLQAYTDLCGVGGMRRFYRHTKAGFMELLGNFDVYDLAIDCIDRREVSFWIEGVMICGDEKLVDEEKLYETQKQKDAAGNRKMSGKDHVKELKKGKIQREINKASEERGKRKVLHILECDEQDDFSSDEFSDVVKGSSDEFDSALDSDDEVVGARNSNRPKRAYHDNKHAYDPTFALEMTFATKDDFRRAIHSHGVLHLRTTKVVKNDKKMLWAKCMESDQCGWRVHCHKVKDGPGFQVHTYVSTHDCAPTQQVKCANSGWLATRFLHKFKIEPNKNPKVFALEVQDETGVVISTYPKV